MTELEESNHLSRTAIFPDWPVPSRVQAVSTTRIGGVSRSPYDSLNLGDHVGDDLGAVTANRRRLLADFALPHEPAWLRQVHGNKVVAAEYCAGPVEADAIVAHKPGWVCVVMTADCLPVLLCSRDGACVAAVHAGWRGLIKGVITASVARMRKDPGELLAWLGPAIGPNVFEVGMEVYSAFVGLDSVYAECFRPAPAGRWLANIYDLAHQQLRGVGISAVFGGQWCTLTDRERFFSYRRDGRTGRMATLIWLAE